MRLIDYDRLEEYAVEYQERNPRNPLTRGDFKLIDNFLFECTLMKDISITPAARLMTLEDIWTRGDSDPLYLEYRLSKETKLRPAIFQPENSDSGGGDGYMCVVSAWCGSGFYNANEYGKTWRCWTSRPTDEQREKTPWEG